MTQIKFLYKLNMTSESPVYNLSFLFLLPFNCQAQMQVLLLPGAEIKKMFCVGCLMKEEDQNQDLKSTQKEKTKKVP